MSKLYLIIFCLFLLPVLSVAQDDASIEMKLSSTTVGLGGSVYLTITVNSSQELPKPQMPNLSMFEYYAQGTSSNFSYSNGQMESSVTYTYLLMPKREGTFVIKPAVIVNGRDRYKSNEVSLTVGPAGITPSQGGGEQSETTESNSKDVFMTASVSRKSVYVNQQTIMSMKFYHAVRLYSQPDYSAPQTTDFWSDMLTPQKTYTEVVDGRRYNVIEIQTALFPTRSGDLKIGQGMITVSVPSKQKRRSNSPFGDFGGIFQRGESTTIRSQPITVKVKPLPLEGKPENFSGTVGKFNISATADKRTVEVNQPVTVTFRINGTGNIKTVAEPVFEENRDFRIYKSSSDEKVSKINGVVGGTKIFEEVFIPKRSGKLVIPPAQLNYFDPSLKKYKEIETRPIELTVNATEGVDYEDIPYQPVAGRVIDTNAKDILYIKTSTEDLKIKQPLIIVQPLYMVINGIPVLLLLFVLIDRKRRDKLSSDVGYARSRAAKRMAKKRLAAAHKLAKTEKSVEFYAEIRLVIFSYIADKLNISPHGLTSDKLVDIISDKNADSNTIESIKKLLRQADFAQYSSSNVTKNDISQSLELAEKVMVEFEEIEIA